jgi:hypothetical protein
MRNLESFLYRQSSIVRVEDESSSRRPCLVPTHSHYIESRIRGHTVIHHNSNIICSPVLYYSTGGKVKTKVREDDTTRMRSSLPVDSHRSYLPSQSPTNFSNYNVVANTYNYILSRNILWWTPSGGLLYKMYHT